MTVPLQETTSHSQHHSHTQYQDSKWQLWTPLLLTSTLSVTVRTLAL